MEFPCSSCELCLYSGLLIRPKFHCLNPCFSALSRPSWLCRFIVMFLQPNVNQHETGQNTSWCPHDEGRGRKKKKRKHFSNKRKRGRRRKKREKRKRRKRRRRRSKGKKKKEEQEKERELEVKEGGEDEEEEEALLSAFSETNPWGAASDSFNLRNLTREWSWSACFYKQFQQSGLSCKNLLHFPGQKHLRHLTAQRNESVNVYISITAEWDSVIRPRTDCNTVCKKDDCWVIKHRPTNLKCQCMMTCERHPACNSNSPDSPFLHLLHLNVLVFDCRNQGEVQSNTEASDDVSVVT